MLLLLWHTASKEPSQGKSISQKSSGIAKKISCLPRRPNPTTDHSNRGIQKVLAKISLVGKKDRGASLKKGVLKARAVNCSETEKWHYHYGLLSIAPPPLVLFPVGIPRIRVVDEGPRLFLAPKHRHLQCEREELSYGRMRVMGLKKQQFVGWEMGRVGSFFLSTSCEPSKKLGAKVRGFLAF